MGRAAPPPPPPVATNSYMRYYKFIYIYIYRYIYIYIYQSVFLRVGPEGPPPERWVPRVPPLERWVPRVPKKEAKKFFRCAAIFKVKKVLMVSRRGPKFAYSQLGLNPVFLEKPIFGLFQPFSVMFPLFSPMVPHIGFRASVYLIALHLHGGGGGGGQII